VNINIRRAMAEALGWKVWAYSVGGKAKFLLRAPDSTPYNDGKPVLPYEVTPNGIELTSVKVREDEISAWEDLPLEL